MAAAHTMQMLYNSDHFAVVQIDLEPSNGADPGDSPPRRGGYEIVDKLSRKEIYLDGIVARHFRERVDALVQTEPTPEAIDEFLSGFSAWMHQPLVLH